MRTTLSNRERRGETAEPKQNDDIRGCGCIYKNSVTYIEPNKKKVSLSYIFLFEFVIFVWDRWKKNKRLGWIGWNWELVCVFVFGVCWFWLTMSATFGGTWSQCGHIVAIVMGHGSVHGRIRCQRWNRTLQSSYFLVSLIIVYCLLTKRSTQAHWSGITKEEK